MIADDLIAEHIKIDDFLKSETKRFEEHLRPAKERLKAIEQQLHEYLLQQKGQSIKGDHGTAYLSRILTVKVENREALLDFINDNWDEIGNELLLINAQKDAVKRWMEEHDQPPPGVTTDYFVRCNIRRS